MRKLGTSNIEDSTITCPAQNSIVCVFLQMESQHRVSIIYGPARNEGMCALEGIRAGLAIDLVTQNLKVRFPFRR